MKVIKAESDSDSEMPATVKLPEFWPTQAALWFIRADAEFDQKSITTEKTKHSYVVSSLPVEVAARVKDALISPDDTEPYTALRKRLMDTYTLNDYQRGVALLHMPDRPSDTSTALLEMLDYLPETEKRESPGWLFKVLFLEKLPADIRAEVEELASPALPQLARPSLQPVATTSPEMAAASVAALTVYDMVKARCRGAVIERVALLHKSGGKSGTYDRPKTSRNESDGAGSGADSKGTE